MLRDAPDDYIIVIQPEARPASNHARTYNALEYSEVPAINVGVKGGETATKGIVVRRIGAMNRNGNQVLEGIPVGHRMRDPLCYSLFFSDQKETDGTKE